MHGPHQGPLLQPAVCQPGKHGVAGAVGVRHLGTRVGYGLDARLPTVAVKEALVTQADEHVLRALRMEPAGGFGQLPLGSAAHAADRFCLDVARFNAVHRFEVRTDAWRFRSRDGIDEQRLLARQVAEIAERCIRQVGVDDDQARLAQHLFVCAQPFRLQVLDDRHVVHGDVHVARIIQHADIGRRRRIVEPQYAAHIDTRRAALL